MQKAARMSVSAVFGLLLTFVSLFVCAILTSSGVISEASADAAVCIVCGLGAFIAGFLAVMRIRKQALFVGLITGVIYFAILVILGALFQNGIMPQNGVLPILLSAITGAALGGTAGAVFMR